MNNETDDEKSCLRCKYLLHIYIDWHTKALFYVQLETYMYLMYK